MSPAHVFMLHVLEEPQLSVGPFGKELRLERSVELLNGHFGSGSVVHCWAEGENKRHEPPSTKPGLMRSAPSPCQHRGLQQGAYPQIRALPYQYLATNTTIIQLSFNFKLWWLKMTFETFVKAEILNHLRWKKQTRNSTWVTSFQYI